MFGPPLPIIELDESRHRSKAFLPKKERKKGQPLSGVLNHSFFFSEREGICMYKYIQHVVVVLADGL